MQPPEGFRVVRPLALGPLEESVVVERDGATYVCKRLATATRALPEANLAFADETLALERLGGRGAPRLVASGSDDAGPFVVMEHAVGASLRARIAASPEPLAPAEARTLTEACFTALAAVQEAPDGSGVLAFVHGDLSPDNVIQKPDGSIVLVDFGLARFRGAQRPWDGTFRGTALYAAPEAARGEELDGRSDVFSMALTALHAASKQPPRDLPHGAAPALLLVAEEPVLAYAAAVASPFDAALRRALCACVAHERDARPANARAVLAMLGAGTRPETC